MHGTISIKSWLIVYLKYTKVKITFSTCAYKSIVSNWMLYVMCEQLLLIIAENRTEDETNKRQREKLIA